MLPPLANAQGHPGECREAGGGQQCAGAAHAGAGRAAGGRGDGGLHSQVAPELVVVTWEEACYGALLGIPKRSAGWALAVTHTNTHANTHAGHPCSWPPHHGQCIGAPAPTGALLRTPQCQHPSPAAGAGQCGRASGRPSVLWAIQAGR
eukprot:scaffold40794_cov23-Tisochrysis_lutea.AAC.2